ncbi:hypothetical protein pVco7_gp085 [Vibrio phage pVco-7]|uniref:Uncharacterized protein n=1 Tax=Vibrio phage pVco-5 TaxID=1965485 RepID=A0A1W6JUW0_9CAUD|nr:hypothetical protein KNT61_gp085 [Vibrio phage pVco-5]ARM71073.1 hypothetical protein pVco5_085 [Vibrio phage pVco-5]
MIKRNTYIQEEEKVVWKIILPEGASKGRPLAAYGGDGNSKEIDSWEFKDGTLHVNFGIDPIVGELEYEYQIEGDEPIVVDGEGGTINVYVTQHNSSNSTSSQ